MIEASKRDPQVLLHEDFESVHRRPREALGNRQQRTAVKFWHSGFSAAGSGGKRSIQTTATLGKKQRRASLQCGFRVKWTARSPDSM